MKTVETNAPVEKLAFNRGELAASLGISKISLWRLERKGLIKSVPGLRHKLYARSEVERFLALGANSPPG